MTLRDREWATPILLGDREVGHGCGHISDDLVLVDDSPDDPGILVCRDCLDESEGDE